MLCINSCYKSATATSWFQWECLLIITNRLPVPNEIHVFSNLYWQAYGYIVIYRWWLGHIYFKTFYSGYLLKDRLTKRIMWSCQLQILLRVEFEWRKNLYIIWFTVTLNVPLCTCSSAYNLSSHAKPITSVNDPIECLIWPSLHFTLLLWHFSLWPMNCLKRRSSLVDGLFSTCIASEWFLRSFL